MTLAGFGTLAVAACLFAPLVGSTQIHLGRAFDRSIPYADNVDAQIFFVARLPRGWDTVLAKTAQDALLFALDQFARKAGLAPEPTA